MSEIYAVTSFSSLTWLLIVTNHLISGIDVHCWKSLKLLFFDVTVPIGWPLTKGSVGMAASPPSLKVVKSEDSGSNPSSSFY